MPRLWPSCKAVLNCFAQTAMQFVGILFEFCRDASRALKTLCLVGKRPEYVMLLVKVLLRI